MVKSDFFRCDLIMDSIVGRLSLIIQVSSVQYKGSNKREKESQSCDVEFEDVVKRS